MAKNAAKEAGKKPAKAAAKEPAGKPARVPAKERAGKPAKAPVKEAAKKAAKEPAKEAPKKGLRVPAKEPAKKASKAEVKETVKPASKGTPGKTAKKAVTEDLDDDRNDAADSLDEGLRLIQSKPEGILQSELWKELGVDSRKCSRIVKRLEESGLIERVDFKREGIKTYLLRARQQPVNPAHLLAGDELIPCINCELECVVEECHPLMDWMYQLAIVEHTEE